MKNFKSTSKLFFIIALVSFSSCSTVNVVNLREAEGFELDTYQTYNFYQVSSEGEILSERYSQSIDYLKTSIAQELNEKGLARVDENADLKVNIGVVVDEQVQTRRTDIREAPIYIGQRRYRWESKEVEVGRYQEGSVTVDLVDNQQNRLVWQGTVEGVIPQNRSKLNERIDEATDKLFDSL
ncbi:MAG: DUF4136 domain-containing protein [Cyclobacteriaceae bacterium]